jgi:predicted permease
MVARWFLACLLPALLRDEALEELEELHAQRMIRDGRVASFLWYVRQSLVFGLRVRLSMLWGGSLTGLRARSRSKGLGALMSMWTSDVRYSVRALVRNPGFTAIAVFTLALGIGANTAIFSVVRGVLLRPLPFPEADRIVSLSESRVDRGWESASFTYANFWDLQDRHRTFDGVAAFAWSMFNLTGGDDPERVSAGRVSADFFRVLGVRAEAGRTFAPGDDQASADTRIALLSHGLWSRRFGSDAGVVGRSIVLNDESYTVIGILPRGDSWLRDVDLYVPLVRQPDADRGSFELAVIGRLREGVNLEAAQTDLDRIAREVAAEFPEAKGMGIVMSSSSDWVADDSVRRAIWVLMGAVSLLLLIACVNLANLLLARATSRTRERALRTALGADRGRLARLYLTESLILGLAGAVAGLGLAALLVRVLRQLQPGDIPRLSEVGIDGWVLAFTIACALFTGTVTGLVPAVRTPWRFLAGALREGERTVAGTRRLHRLRGVLVSAEVALSLVLLVGAGLLLRSFGRVLGVERGFETENRIIAEVSIPGSYDDERNANFITQYLATLSANPQVVSAAAVSMRPLQGVGTGMGYGAPDRPLREGEAVPWASWRIITHDYLRTMGVPLVAGRNFTDQDAITRPWRVIISERLAESLWPGEEAVGRTMLLWKGQSDNPAEVIGVAGDMRDWGLAQDASLAVYLCCQAGMSPAHIIVHTRGRPQSIVPLMRTTLSGIDSNLPLSNVMTLEDLVGSSVASRRFTMLLLSSLALLALVLALAGVYGVLSYTVARRKSEIGMRVALGASRGTVISLIVAQGMKPVVAGLVLGVGGALALSRLMSSLLFEVTPADLKTYAAVGVALFAAAALACYLPARYATRLNVLAALRQE